MRYDKTPHPIPTPPKKKIADQNCLGHAKVLLLHSELCRTTKRIERVTIHNLVNTHLPLGKYVAEWTEDPTMRTGCIGKVIKPDTSYMARNDFCGNYSCVPRRLSEILRKAAKADYRGIAQTIEEERPETGRYFEKMKADQRKRYKEEYKQVLIEKRNDENFHVLDMRCLQYPKKLDDILPKFLTKVEAPYPFDESDQCTASCGQELSKKKKGDVVVKTPCDHYFHRSCIISWICSRTGQSCPNCGTKYEIYLFNGFDPTIFKNSLVEIQAKLDLLYSQPFKIITAGYIPGGATAMDTRARVRLETKQKADDHWGDYNDEKELDAEVANWAEEQKERWIKWNSDLNQNVAFLQRHFPIMEAEFPELEPLITPPAIQNQEQFEIFNRAHQRAEELWAASSIPNGDLTYAIQPQVMAFLGFSEDSALPPIVETATNLSISNSALLTRWSRAMTIARIRAEQWEASRQLEEQYDLYG